MGILKRVRNGVVNKTVSTVNKFLHNKPRVASFASQVVGGGMTVYNRVKNNPYAKRLQNNFVGHRLYKPIGVANPQAPRLAGSRQGRRRQRGGQNSGGKRGRVPKKPNPLDPRNPNIPWIKPVGDKRKRHNLRSYKYRNKFRFYF